MKHSDAGLRTALAAASAVAAAVLALLVPLVGGLAEPGYSHVSQYISELGAVGAAYGALVSGAGFVPIGILVLAFLVLGSRAFPRTATTMAGLICVGAVGVAYVVTGIFRCDTGCPSSGSLSQSVHNLFGLIEYVGAIAGFVLLTFAFRPSVVWRSCAWVCAVGALGVGVAFVAMANPDLAAHRGISQRIAEAAIFLWIGYVGLFLLRRQQRAAER